MKRLLVGCFVALSLSSCASTQETMIHPDSGLTQDCSAFGFGFIGLPAALIMQAECEKKYKAQGYLTSEEFAAKGGKLPANHEKVVTAKQ